MQAISKRRSARSQNAAFRTCTAVRNLRWRSSIVMQALDRFCAGVIVADDCGRVIEMNRAARSILRVENGLAVRNGQLCAGRVFESTRLAKLIATAAAADRTGPAAGRMLIGRGNGRPAYVLTVAPLRPDLAIGDRPLAMIVIVDPERHSPSESDLVELFGLSPAEARLATALMRGERLSGIAADFGVQVATLRTQLGSILKKVGADRQSDLIRILSNTGIGSVSLSAAWFDMVEAVTQLPLWLSGA
jgi:DNA-binding CsgD family transcriptional regulator